MRGAQMMNGSWLERLATARAWLLVAAFLAVAAVYITR
jgi:hypothetical protein